MAQEVLIIGSSGGIGAALCARYAAQGARVTGLSRREDGLDLTDPARVDAILGALKGPFDVMIVASGALVIDGQEPEKSLRAVEAGAMAAQFALNAIGPALCLRHAARLLPRDRPAYAAVLSARVGSIGDNRMGGWYSYRAAKAALNQILRSAAIELARSHPQAVLAALHPGTVATQFGARYRGNRPALSPDQSAARLCAVLAGLSPAQSGGFFDYTGAPVPW